MNILKIALQKWAAAWLSLISIVLLNFSGVAQAAIPGITGTSFNLVATADYSSHSDGSLIYSWGYGCASPPAGFVPFPGNCPAMQIPGPTMIVNEGQSISITLTNNLPVAAGNTSIVFPGLDVTAAGGVPGQLTREAEHGGQVTYTFVASKPGTYGYHSGTQADLQVEMGLYGAIIVLPATAQAGCIQGQYSLAANAYNHADTCYDREYLFQLSEMNADIHAAVEEQVAGPGPIVATMQPYQAQFFLVNGRGFPDDVDIPYSVAMPNQPYNANPQMHPTDRLLLRVIAQGHMQHPLHIHANHARMLARDADLIVSQNDPGKLAGPLVFTIAPDVGQTQDLIFTWTGKGLNWDVYGHKAADNVPCHPDAYGYYTENSNPAAVKGVTPNYGEWCADHNKPLPVTPPDPNIVAAGQFYGGSPYLGFYGGSATLAPGVVKLNEGAAYAFPWHSHAEREITTNNVFPGGLMMMLLVIPSNLPIDETK